MKKGDMKIAASCKTGNTTTAMNIIGAISDGVSTKSDCELDEIEQYINSLQTVPLIETTDNKSNGNASHRKPSKPETSALFDGLIDVVDLAGKPMYLMNTGQGFEVIEKWSDKDKELVPPQKDRIPWQLPDAESVLDYIENDSDERLFDDLVAYHKEVSELPDERYYSLLAAWDMHTYLLEKFEHSPMICLYAVAERGKTRTGKAMTYVAYRGMHVESVNPSNIFRMADASRLTLFIDAMDIWSKAKAKGSEDVLLLRFEKGAKVSRTSTLNKGAFDDVSYFNIFGATIIATNEPTHPILDTRSITINMRNSQKKFNMPVTPENATDLVNRLTAFRARHLSSELPYIEKPAHGRLGDITRPLVQIVELVKTSSVPMICKLICDIQEERGIEKSQQFEGRILVVVHSLADKVTQGVLPVKLIADTFNKDCDSRDRVTYQKVGRVLKELGFRKSTLAGNCSAIVWDDDNLARTMSSYGVGSSSCDELIYDDRFEVVSQPIDMSLAAEFPGHRIVAQFPMANSKDYDMAGFTQALYEYILNNKSCDGAVIINVR